MTVLLDTHMLVWLWSGDKRFSKTHRDMFSDQEVAGVISVASIWELSIKQSIGKLELEVSVEQLLSPLVNFGFSVLPVNTAHAMAVRGLPLHHRDPFDRMLIAQAKTEGIHLLSADPHFAHYDVQLLRA